MRKTKGRRFRNKRNTRRQKGGVWPFKKENIFNGLLTRYKISSSYDDKFEDDLFGELCGDDVFIYATNGKYNKTNPLDFSMSVSATKAFYRASYYIDSKLSKERELFDEKYGEDHVVNELVSWIRINYLPNIRNWSLTQGETIRTGDKLTDMRLVVTTFGEIYPERKCSSV